MSDRDRDTLTAKLDELRQEIDDAENRRGDYGRRSSRLNLFDVRQRCIADYKTQIAAIEAVLREAEAI